MKRLLAAALVLGLVACASAPKKPATTAADAGAPGADKPARKISPYAPAQEDPGTRGDYTAGGLYKPGVPDSTPEHIPDVDLIPEPEVVAEPRSRAGNRSSYSVLGKQYHVLDSAEGYQERGLASYYGKKFHGRRTSNLEVYDMYAFTAAHKTLPLPSFARVTNLDNGKSVVVRVNDRGPFHEGRIVDLSYAAAVKLGITRRGTGRVEMRALTPGEPDKTTAGASPADQPAGADAPPASTMDRLVASLPIAAAPAGEPAPAASDWRFDMHQDGRVMTADEFDRWMQRRQVRVATGQPASAPGPRAARGGAVVLQVASFSARGNADRALAMLRAAGIDDARLLDTAANGRPFWRLRVGPLDAAAAPQLALRIAGLGFGPPQPVPD